MQKTNGNFLVLRSAWNGLIKTINHGGHSEAQSSQRRDRREIKIENVTT